MLARISACIVFLGTAAAACAAPETRSVWSGVFTEAQAARGEAAYTAECSRCHKDDLSAYGGVLVGQKFMDQWREDSLDSFFTILRQTMPRNAPASLGNGVYLDIVAYVLRMNAFPAGDKELTTESLPGIRVEGKDGPEPVPDFALVEAVVCLAQASDGTWAVTNASEPVRTRNPDDSTTLELQALKSKPLGAHT